MAIARLRQMGFQVEMDDFGSGFSSLSMLHRINVDTLKLDLKFLQNMLDDERGHTILHTVFSLARDLSVGLIAEGVESAAQLQLLEQLGCRIFQGYYFARPMTEAALQQQYHMNVPEQL